jgi:hypothetical protein
MDTMYPDPFGREPEPDLTDLDTLLDEVERQAALLTAVATGGPRIEDVNQQYKKRRRRLIAALERRGLEYPFPWQDLWQWYGYWSGNVPGYGPRRAMIREFVAPVIETLEEQRSGLSVSDPGSGPLTRVELDARLAGLSAELDGALSRDDLQDVGRRAREILIDCAGLLADPSLVPARQTPPKAADAKAWLDLFLDARAAGRHREALRRLIHAAWRLAQTVTHGDVGRVEAFAAAQATVLVVRTLQALATRPPWDLLRPAVAAPSALFVEGVDDDLGLAPAGALDLLVDPRPQLIGSVEAHQTVAVRPASLGWHGARHGQLTLPDRMDIGGTP